MWKKFTIRVYLFFYRLSFFYFNFSSKETLFLEQTTKQNVLTRRDRLKSAPYLRLKNIQRTTIGNIWKNYRKSIFFRKKCFLESRTMPKNSKRGHSGSLNVFTNRKLAKKCKGLPFDRVQNFSKKKSHSAEKNPKGGPFGLTCCTFGSIKILWFSARIEPPLSGLEDEQI